MLVRALTDFGLVMPVADLAAGLFTLANMHWCVADTPRSVFVRVVALAKAACSRTDMTAGLATAALRAMHHYSIELKWSRLLPRA